MGFLIILFLCVLAYLNPRSKIVSFTILAFMWVLYGFNTYSGDFIAYENVYNNLWDIGLMHYEPGFSMIMAFCRSFGMSFIMFRVALAFIFVYLLYNAIKKYTQYSALALAIYLIFPFPYFISVLRGGVASLIILYSIDFLREENQRRGAFKFVLGVMIAALFHYTSVFYLVLLFARKEIDAKKIGCLLGIEFFVIFLWNRLDIQSILAIFIDREKTLDWFAQQNYVNNMLNVKGVLSNFLIVFGNIYFSRIIKENNIKQMDGCESRDLWVSKFAYNANLLMLLLAPFLFYRNVVLRFIWELQGINIVTAVNAIKLLEENRKEKKKRVVSIIGLISVEWVIGLFFYIIGPVGTENSLLELFRNNLFHLI